MKLVVLFFSFIIGPCILFGQLNLNKFTAPSIFQSLNPALESKDLKLSVLYGRELSYNTNKFVSNIACSYSPKPKLNFSLAYKNGINRNSFSGIVGVYSNSNRQILGDPKKIIHNISVFSSIGYSLSNYNYNEYSYRKEKEILAHFFSQDFTLLAGLKLHRRNWGFQISQAATLQDIINIEVITDIKGATIDPIYSIVAGNFPIIMTTNFQFNIGRRYLIFFIGYQSNRFLNNKELNAENGYFLSTFFTGINYTFKLPK